MAIFTFEQLQSTNYQEELRQQLLITAVNELVIVYMGSFSPVTLGHKAVIVDSLSLLTTVLSQPATTNINIKLLLVPVSDNHCKPNLIRGGAVDGSNVATSNVNSHRLRMCQMMVNEIIKQHPNSNITVSDWLLRPAQQFITSDGGHELTTKLLTCGYQSVIADSQPSLAVDDHQPTTSVNNGVTVRVRYLYVCGQDVFASMERWPAAS